MSGATCSLQLNSPGPGRFRSILGERTRWSPSCGDGGAPLHFEPSRHSRCAFRRHLKSYGYCTRDFAFSSTGWRELACSPPGIRPGSAAQRPPRGGCGVQRALQQRCRSRLCAVAQHCATGARAAGCGGPAQDPVRDSIRPGIGRDPRAGDATRYARSLTRNQPGIRGSRRRRRSCETSATAAGAREEGRLHGCRAGGACAAALEWQ